MSQKARMLEARDLIKQRHYFEALDILETIDHPVAHKWVNKINSILDIEHTSSGQYSENYANEPTSEADTFFQDTQDKEKVSTNNGTSDLVLLVYALIAGPIIAGVLTLFVAWAFYAPIAWLGITSFFGVLAMWLGIRLSKVRDGVVGAAIGAFIALLIWIGFYLMTYMLEIHQFTQEFGTVLDFQQQLEIITGQTGIVGYFLYRSTLAVELEIYRIPIYFEGTSLLASILLDLPISMGIIAFYSHRRTQELFCEQTNSWIKFKSIGRVPADSAEDCLYHMRNGNYSEARALVQRFVHNRSAYITISVAECHDKGYLKIETNKLETSMEGTHIVDLGVVRALKK